jgi:hypothetical protein
MAINLFRKPGDPYDPIMGPLQSGVFGTGYRRSAATPLPGPTATPSNTLATATPGYTPPAKGTVRGSAKFGAGLGANNDNGFNINEAGAGLWAQGIDVNSPNVNANIKAVYDAKIGTDTDFSTRIGAAATKENWNVNTDAGRYNAVDWYYRDLSRRMDKSSSFLDSTIGKVLTVGAEIAASFIPGVGPAISASIGAVTGGLTGGPLGALTGALSGYGIGKGTQFIAGGGIQSTFGSLFSKSAPIVEGTGTASGVAGAASAGKAAQGATLLTKAAGVAKGAASNVDTAVSAVNLGLGVRSLLAGAAVAGGAAVALTSSTGTPSGITASPPQAVATTEEELQREKEQRRRRITQTNNTWGNTLLAPMIKRPTLLGGSTKLAA